MPLPVFATEAVVDGGRSQPVFVDLGGGYVEPREVTTGERFGGRVEILRGLDPGQRIVTSGNFLLGREPDAEGMLNLTSVTESSGQLAW